MSPGPKLSANCHCFLAQHVPSILLFLQRKGEILKGPKHSRTLRAVGHASLSRQDRSPMHDFLDLIVGVKQFQMPRTGQVVIALRASIAEAKKILGNVPMKDPHHSISEAAKEDIIGIRSSCSDGGCLEISDAVCPQKQAVESRGHGRPMAMNAKNAEVLVAVYVSKPLHLDHQFQIRAILREDCRRRFLGWSKHSQQMRLIGGSAR